MGVPQPKPMQGFSPKFQDMLTERGSKADWVLEVIWKNLLPWQCFKYFLVFFVEKGPLLNQCYYSCIFISHQPGLGDYEMPSVHVYCVQLSHFFINLYISFIYEDIFTKFEENVYGCEKVCKKIVVF